jgi:hypothetical protein
MEEIWRDIPNYEGIYKVSNFGNVKSLKRESFNGKVFIEIKERILKQSFDGYRYLKVSLHKNNKLKTFTIHRLVAMAFLNHISNGKMIVVDHINNNPLDNRLENLQIVTQRNNLSKDKKNKSSKHTGVSWHKRDCIWTSSICINNKLIHLGNYKSEYEAHLAYQNKLKEIENV